MSRMIFSNEYWQFIRTLTFFWGPVLTTAVVAAIEAGRFFDLTIPNPQLFTAVAITFAAYSGGYRGGLLSATRNTVNTRNISGSRAGICWR